jgi:hypothetical protein
MLSAVEERCREERIALRRMGVLSGGYLVFRPLIPSLASRCLAGASSVSMKAVTGLFHFPFMLVSSEKHWAQ